MLKDKESCERETGRLERMKNSAVGSADISA
jgi:hypothetical protein